MKVVWLLGRIGAVQLQHAGMISCMSSILSLMLRVLKLCLCCGVHKITQCVSLSIRELVGICRK